MKKLSQEPKAKKKSSNEKAWWVCLIAALSCCLWGANVLPVQQVEYQLTTNVAISQHRLPCLERLTVGSNYKSVESLAAISALEIQSNEANVSTAANSDLRSVRIRMRFPTRGGILDIEQSLKELTTPSFESTECQSLAKQIQKERWLLESNNHSLKRLELDLDREKNAIETDLVASDENTAFETSTPFRLTSFGSRGAGEQAPLELGESLRQLAHSRTQRVESMVLALERLKAKARGFLSFTGSPRIEPVVRPMTHFRLFILCALCTSFWLLWMAWLQPIHGNLQSLWKQASAICKSINKAKLHSVPDEPPMGIRKTLHWMQREGIPYLGAIHIHQLDDAAPPPIVRPGLAQSKEDVTSNSLGSIPNNSIRFDSSDQINSIQWLRSLGEGSLVLWTGLFVARLMFDSVWRELVAVAPLSAISRLIVGIQ